MLVVVGETGSGKTTQIPQYLYEAGYADNDKIIGVTQPRRVAAVSVCRRVADERDARVGGLVGFKIRFNDETSRATRIKYMTDGSLVRECLTDPTLSRYSVLMLDEAHERSIHTDILFGLLKRALRSRPALKLLVSSATLDTAKFAAYLDGAPVVNIPGRTFPVAVYHSKSNLSAKAKMGRIRSGKGSTAQAAVDIVVRIHSREAEGDVLVFLTGQAEIELACKLLRDMAAKVETGDYDGIRLNVLPLYGALPGDQQARVFEPTPEGTRKVVIATNIAETSLTVDGIRYVVDPGFVKQKEYDAERGIESLGVVSISKVGAAQRAGRAGRTAPGKCYRLYTKEAFDEMADATEPEIQRTNLANVVLYLKVLGIVDVLGFEFLDPPPEASLRDALKQLFFLGAITEEGKVTDLGREMAHYPLEPKLSRMLIESRRLGVQADIHKIGALLSAENVFYDPPRPKGEPEGKNTLALQAKEAHASFFDETGDHLTYLRVYQQWQAAGCSDEWCKQHFVRVRAMRLARSIEKQLLQNTREAARHQRGGGRGAEKGDAARKPAKVYASTDVDVYGKDQRKAILKAVCAGFFLNSAERCGASDAYRLRGEEFRLMHLHPTGALVWGDLPTGVVYHESTLTNRNYMRHVSGVKSRWIKPYLPKSFKVDVMRLTARKTEQPTTSAASAAKGASVATSAATGAAAAGKVTLTREEKLAAARARLAARRKAKK